MKQFFKMMFASMLGYFLLQVIILFIMIGFVASIVAVSSKETVIVSKNSILHMKFDFPISERSPNGPSFNTDIFGGGGKNAVGLFDILESIRKAKEDKNIKGILLEPEELSASMATIAEIREALLDFKKSGKFIYSYGEVYTQKGYYLASVSDKVFLNATGVIELKGVSAEIMFMKGLFDKLDVQMQVIRHGKFKSAVEPYIMQKMSPENKVQIRMLIDNAWNTIATAIAESRKISVEELNKIADNLLIRNPVDAIDYKLADSLVYKDQLLAILKKQIGIEQDKDISSVTIQKYVKAEGKEEIESKDKIAIIFAAGEIRRGEGSDEIIGSDRISKAIREAREDKKVKAIVLRVNSPGGDALASDIIWREVVLAREKKPVIVSMGDVAASGGYYIACGASKIIASPSTITGSIGVFGVIPNLQKLYNNKLGISFDTVLTHRNANLMSVNRPMSSYEQMVITQEIERIYGTFISRVAEGRKMSLATVDSIGQGRVWSGTDAKKIGLIDDFGGIDKAIAEAAKMAKLSKYKLRYYPDQENALEELFKEIFGNTKTNALQKELGQEYELYKTLKETTNWKGIQARLPFMLTIE